MPLYRPKNSPHWYADYTDGSGQRTRRSTETADRREAEDLLAKWRLEARQQKHWNAQPRRSFDDLILGYLKETQGRLRSPHSRLTAAKPLTAHFTGRMLDDISTAEIKRYALQRRHAVAASTVNKEVGLLSAALNHARSVWGWDVTNIAQGCRQREPQSRTRWLTPAEAQALIHTADANPYAPYLADLLQLAFHTGMRRGELTGLLWTQIHLSQRLVTLDPDQTKTGKRRGLPLNDAALAAIMNRLRYRNTHGAPTWTHVFCKPDGTPLGDIKTAFHGTCRRAGIKNFRLHDTRHTFAAWLVQSGASLAQVRDLLGHSSVQMTERYAHLAPDATRRAVERLSENSHSGVRQIHSESA